MTTTTTEEKTLPQLCEEFGFKLQLKKAKTPHNASKWQMNCANSWLAVISYNGYSMAVPYFTGKAIKKTTTADVVYSLTSDWNTWKSCENVQGFAGEFGWDDDTITTWETIERLAKEWEHFVGDVLILETLAEVSY
jgi:hypothetical protein